MMNLASVSETTGTYGVTYRRERFSDKDTMWNFAVIAGATKNLKVFDYGQEEDGAYYVDVMDYAPYAFPNGKP